MSKSDPQYTIQDRFLDQPYVLAGRLIDPISGSLLWQGKREHLRRKELEVLALLASAEGKQVSRDNFVAVVWQGNDLVGDRGLSNTIVFVRRSLRDEDPNQPLIRTIPRRGYQLAVPVELPGEQPGEPPTPSYLFEAGASIPECPGWRLVRQLSTSPVSESWLAEPSEFGERDQGLRVFRFCRSEAHLRQLQREITLLRYLTQSLADRNDIVLIRDWQLDEPPYYLASDYASEGNLYDWIAAGKLSKDPNDRLKLMLALTEALAAVHALGVVHRQLSAKTILVDQTQTGPQLKISAFDLAALSDRSLLEPHKITAVGLTIGVEEATSEATVAEDVHALGIVLMQLALGDVDAKSDQHWLERIQNIGLRATVSRCFGPLVQRPSANVLVAELGRLGAPMKSSTPLAISATVLDAVDAAQASDPIKAGGAGIKPAKTVLLGVPETIGNYKLLDRLGEGGMGTVYLAEQLEPYRKVALKIIRAGLDGKQILSRFEAERQALALMNHPNVTTVLDSGLAADGRPFFAMEYVKGEEITKYCDSHHLNLATRIKLFLQVCDGVLHAHQKGVLHRDIKPSNLMVSEAQDNAGTLKIIDFGLAKSLHGKLALHTLHTSFGAFVGTPIYSSPEHISGAASGVDTRSDIYSMGVVLYELLAGTTPIANESLENLEPEKLRDVVCKSKLPSMREQLQNTSAEKRSLIAAHRSMKFDDLPKTLDGDLSWVVGKCLERDPNDRYASVLELKKDLERWLENRPVEAKPITWRYRVRKMVRRNRGAVLVGSAVALALLITSTAAIMGFVRTKQALAEAELAAEFQTKQMKAIDPAIMGLGYRESLLEAVKQRDVKQGMTEAAAKARQDEIKRQLAGVNFTDLSLKQLKTFYTEPALAAIENDLSQSPLLQAKLWTSVASIQSSFGEFEDALRVQNMALTQQRQLLDEQALPVIQSLRQRGDILTSLGRGSDAESDLRAAANSAESQFGPPHIETLKTKNALAFYLAQTGQTKEMIEVLPSVLETCRKSLGSDHVETLRAMNLLTIAYVDENDLSKAEPLATELVERSGRIFGLSNKKTLGPALQLARIFARKGQLKKAEDLERELLLRAKSTLGEKHLHTNFIAMNLNDNLTSQGRLDAAEIVNQEAFDNVSEILGPTNHMSLIFQINLAESQFGQQKLRKAEQNFRQVISIRQNQLPIHSPHLVNAKARLAAILVAQENYADALPILRNSLKFHREALGAEHEQIMLSERTLAFTLMRMGNLEEAQKLYTETLNVHTRALGADNSDTLSLLSEYAWLLKLMNRQIEAETKLRQVLAAQRLGKHEEKIPMYVTLARLVSLLRDQGKLDEAFSLGQEMLAADDMVQNNSYQFGLLQINHAHTLTKLGKYPEAEVLYLAAYRNLTRWSDEARELRELAKALVDLYGVWNRAKPSAELESKARQWRQRFEQFEKRFGGKPASASIGNLKTPFSS